MICPNCNYEIDESEIFCGNCGQQLKPQTINFTNYQINQSPLAANIGSKVLPNYALLKQIPRISKSVFVCFSAVILAGVTLLFISPLVSLIFSLISMIAATFISRRHHLFLKITGIILASIIVIISVGLFVYNYDQIKITSSQNKNSFTTFSSVVNTNCYSFSFPTMLYLSKTLNSCSILAYNGNSVSTSTVFYKIVSLNDVMLNSSNFVSLIKPLIIKDVNKNLSTFHIVKEFSTTFAGNLAYQIMVTNNKNNVSIIEEGVYHPATFNNLFDIIYASNGKNLSLNNLQLSWLWKN